MKKSIKNVGILVFGLAFLFILLASDRDSSDKDSSIAMANGTDSVSRVVYFPIQSNNVCGAVGTSKYRSSIYLSINNISDVPTQVTLYLYKKDGTHFIQPGSAGYGVNSDITPGTMLTIGSNSTVQYANYFGNSSTLACGERPTYGKIVVNSNTGQILANGSMSGERILEEATPPHWESYNNSDILINAGKPF